MKTLIAGICLLCATLASCPAQESADVFDVSLLLDSNPDSQGAVLAKIVKRVGDVSQCDFIAVLFEEHIHRARIISFGGVKIPLIRSDGTKIESFESYVAFDPSGEPEDGNLKYFRASDSQKHVELLNLAWDLVCHAKVDVQYKNFMRGGAGIPECYFFVNSRVFSEFGVSSFVGGHILNPLPGTRSHKFFEALVREEVNWNLSIRTEKLNPEIKVLEQSPGSKNK